MSKPYCHNPCFSGNSFATGIVENDDDTVIVSQSLF